MVAASRMEPKLSWIEEKAHAELARRIAETGLIVSEYAPGVEPAPWRFPARNRIVAGLTAATVVVEARERSGALITADLALEEGREVFAVPGEITSALSAGTNALLKLGASPLTAAADVLHSFGIEAEIDTREASPLLELLPATADELVRTTGRDAADIARFVMIGHRRHRALVALEHLDDDIGGVGQ